MVHSTRCYSGHAALCCCAAPRRAARVPHRPDARPVSQWSTPGNLCWSACPFCSCDHCFTLPLPFHCLHHCYLAPCAITGQPPPHAAAVAVVTLLDVCIPAVIPSSGWFSHSLSLPVRDTPPAPPQLLSLVSARLRIIRLAAVHVGACAGLLVISSHTTCCVASAGVGCAALRRAARVPPSPRYFGLFPASRTRFYRHITVAFPSPALPILAHDAVIRLVYCLRCRMDVLSVCAVV